MTTTQEKSTTDLEAALSQFIGTTRYYKFNSLFSMHVLTDGAKYLAETAGAYWLMEAIASHHITARRKRIDTSFQVWTLRHIEASGNWELKGTDGNETTIARQIIGYSDFPLDEITLYCVSAGSAFVIMLPREY